MARSLQHGSQQQVVDVVIRLLPGFFHRPAVVRGRFASGAGVALANRGRSFVEYAMHRFLFHAWYRREHWTHHLDVLALIGISSWKTTATFIALLALFQAVGLASLIAGVMLGYLAYISLHYVMHRPEHPLYRLMPGLVTNHDLHHQRGVEKNFGVSSPLWDHVFGTYVRVRNDALTQSVES